MVIINGSLGFKKISVVYLFLFFIIILISFFKKIVLKYNEYIFLISFNSFIFMIVFKFGKMKSWVILYKFLIVF